MSDSSPGAGWWLASDGQWYPPHLHPDVRARADVVVDDSVPESAVSSVDESADETAAPAGPQRLPDDGISIEADREPEALEPQTREPETREPETREPEPAVPPAGPATVAATGNGRGALPPQFVPPREPIDWARVAEERAARRRQAESRRTRNLVIAVLAAVATLAVLFFVARNVADDGGDEDNEQAEPTVTTAVIAPTTTAAPVSSSTTAVPTTTATPGTVSVFALQPGTCVQNPELLTGRVTTVVEVPCDQPHTHEVYHKVTYTPPDSAFDEARVSQFASEQCTQSFAAYVGIPFDRSKYYYVQFSPTQESWTQQGDREVVCLLFQQGAELTGSAKGTAQ